MEKLTPLGNNVIVKPLSVEEVPEEALSSLIPPKKNSGRGDSRRRSW
jgi:hypothetical protein